VNGPNDEAVIADVRRRLDEIFEGVDEEEPEVSERALPAFDSPLKNMKDMVIAIDGKMTDEFMDGFLEEVNKLRESYADERVPLLFLKLLGSLGKYIRNRKTLAHPGAFSVLNSVYDGFERVMLDQSMPEVEKRNRLVRELNRFKQLKKAIVEARAEGSESSMEQETEPSTNRPDEEAPFQEVQPEPTPPASEETATPQYEAIAHALEEIKQLIKTEFRAIREELGLRRNGS